MAKRKFARRAKTRMMKITLICLVFVICGFMTPTADTQNRPRARELGITVGILPTGPLNAITDVDGSSVTPH